MLPGAFSGYRWKALKSVSYKEDHTINIDTVENVIKFSRKSERGTCEHKNIQISAEENEVLDLKWVKLSDFMLYDIAFEHNERVHKFLEYYGEIKIK